MIDDTKTAGDGTDGGRTRRQYVAGVAAVATAGVAGCSDILGGGSGGGDPQSTIRAFVDAATSGEIEDANELIHPDAPAPQVTQQQSNSMQQLDMSIESMEVIEEGEEMAMVSVTFSVTSQEGSGTITNEFELRTHEGEWRIWSPGNN